jgi:histidinol-phosphate aminotransferase
MSPYWNPLLQQLHPYVPGEQPQGQKLVKLNTNENPYGPAPEVLAAIAAVNDEGLRLYPDPQSRALKQAYAAYHGIDQEQVFIGNGSDEVLAHTFLALLKHDAPVLFPDISYSFYPVYCGLYQIEHREIPLREDFTLALEDYTRDNGGIIFPNPNAPTGIYTPLEALRALLQRNTDSVVVVDEAYIDFGGESAVRLIDDYPNLLVIQTLSKSRSLAGLRVGAAFGQHELIAGLERVKNSFNSYPLGRLSEAGAVAALQHDDWFRKTRADIIETRDWLDAQLQKLGFEVLPSSANFVFTRHQQRTASDVFAALRERGVIVRHFSAPRIKDWLRISIGTREECAALVAALEQILGSGA